MGFEIKNICTVVPNPHHELYKSAKQEDQDYYYFSVFITPKLQFDGTLKEFYEMLNWPEYVERIFYNIESYGKPLDFINLIFSDNQKTGNNLIKDYSFVKSLCKQMKITDDDRELKPDDLKEFLSKSKLIWRKLFDEKVPVEAWPIYLKPQQADKINELNKTLSEKVEEIFQIYRQNGVTLTSEYLNANLREGKKIPSTGNSTVDDQIDNKRKNIDQINKEIDLEKGKVSKTKIEKTKYRQEFHKKISALARYPHILRILGLIQDFKISKIKFTEQIKNDVSTFFVKLNFDLSPLNSIEIDVEEFKKSIQFITPFTKCSLRDEKDNQIENYSSINNIAKLRFRSFYIYDTTKINDSGYYGNYVNNGFLKTAFIDHPANNPSDSTKWKRIPVFEVDQDYFEDRSQEFKNSNQLSNSVDNQETKVVGINGKVFNDEEIEILKQKVSNVPRISKGFSIKVHSQPGSLLTNMDQKLKELTDDNIEDEKSAFMAHHLDCGYRVDVNIITMNGDKYLKQTNFNSLCQRQAKYIVDRKDDDIYVPILNHTITLKDEVLFDNLQDEPWLEEVRLINNDGTEDRFEEIARWNGWSLTCPPLYADKSAENKEADDLELSNIRPLHLPKLRFGEKYQYHFRIRTVDICGNGPSLGNLNDFPQECIFKGLRNDTRNEPSLSYYRKESIGAPLFFPPYEIIPDLDDKKKKNSKKKKEQGYNIDPRYKGEDNETLVIRTGIKTDGTIDTIDQECVRYITPPYVTMHFAELSGMLDPSYANAKNSDIDLQNLYKILAAEPKHYYEKADIEGKQIPFLFDPKINSLEIISGDDNILTDSRLIFYKDKEKIVEESKAIKFVLKSLPDKSTPVVQHNSKTVEFNFAVGTSNIFAIKSVTLDNGNVNVPDTRASKQFQVIHAVQRPYLESISLISNQISLNNYLVFEKTIPSPDTYSSEQKYQVRIKGLLNETKNIFPFSTTGELVLHAEYNEYELNPENEKGWSYISKDNPKVKNHKPQPGIGEENKDQADKFYIRKSWSNLHEATENSKFDTIIKDNFQLDDLRNFNYFIHSFPDTKFRRVKYKLEAVSKFSEFFDIDKHNIDKKDKSPFSLFATLDNILEYGEYYTIIANSGKPSKPNITSIVPIFTITNPDEDHYTFENKTFRIYLGKAWYETGLGEKIAIIHEEKANTLKYEPTSGIPLVTKKADSTILDSSYIKKKISIFANDPTDSILNKSDSIKCNVESYISPDSVNVKPVDSARVNTYLFENSIDKPNQIQNTSKEHVFSVFEVNWDKQQNQFYCDIRINEAAITAYTYLLKFALCRYQENSIYMENEYDYRFSDVVMTDMITTLPKRTIEFNRPQNMFTLKGVKGGRYSFSGKAHTEHKFRPNKIFLIAEKNKEINQHDSISYTSEDYYELVKDNVQFDIPYKYESTNGNLFIEEYEDIRLDDDFYIDDNLNTNPKYNPRSDPRKRLVFFYKIG